MTEQQLAMCLRKYPSTGISKDNGGEMTYIVHGSRRQKKWVIPCMYIFTWEQSTLTGDNFVR